MSIVLVAVLAVVDVLILAAAGGVLVGIVQDRRRVAPIRTPLRHKRHNDTRP